MTKSHSEFVANFTIRLLILLSLTIGFIGLLILFRNTNIATASVSAPISNPISGPISPTPTPTPTPSPTRVASFDLVFPTRQGITGWVPLRNGMEFDSNRLPKQLIIRANTRPSIVGSVKFSVNNFKFWTDNNAPYKIYLKNRPKTYTLTATPYSGKNAQGNLGTPLTITFTIR